MHHKSHLRFKSAALPISQPRIWVGILLALVLALASVMSALAAPGNAFPEVIPLPNGFQPEGITTGVGHTFYAGSLVNGAIYKGDYRTGEGTVIFPGEEGRVSVGMDYDPRSGYLFVAGGPTGNAYIYDGSTGEPLATYMLAEGNSFINDVVVTKDAAYFTNSFQSFYYEIPLSKNGQLPDESDVRTIPLEGDYVPAPGFSANGIDATPNGKQLIIVTSGNGALYLLPAGGSDAQQIDLGGEDVLAGDGILLDGKTLYVVQNQFFQIAVVKLSPDLTIGDVAGTISDSDFRFPTTIAEFGNALYAVNARFDVPNPTPDTEYEVVRVSKR